MFLYVTETRVVVTWKEHYCFSFYQIQCAWKSVRFSIKKNWK